MTTEEWVRRWSAAIREVEVLEPWLTQSHGDERYWDDVAQWVVEGCGESPTFETARRELAAALQRAFPGRELAAGNGLYRDSLDRRLDLIVAGVIGPPMTPAGRVRAWLSTQRRRAAGTDT